MALLVFDGFDHYATMQDVQSRSGGLQWSTIAPVGASVPTVLTTGRDGSGQGVQMGLLGGSLPSIFGGSFTTLPALYLGIAMKVLADPVAYVDLQVMTYTGGQNGQGAPQITVRCFTQSGLIEVFSGDPNTTNTSNSATPTQYPIGNSPTNAFNAYLWNYFEIYVLAPSSTTGAPGAFDVHVNGTSVVSSSNADTLYPTPLPDGSFLSVTTYDGFQVRVPPTSGVNEPGVILDDFYLCDTTTGAGTYPMNTFTGDVTVKTLYPNANYGTPQWTPLSGTNWQEVSETLFDGDTTYNSATSAGAVDLFSFQQLPTTVASVLGVQLTGAYRKLDASAQVVQQRFVSGPTTTPGNNIGPSVSYAFYTDLTVLDPNTSATWTVAGVNAMAGGYKLIS
jgi:hypothetical protein